MIKLIVCSDIHGGIGRSNDLLFNIKEDMKFFKEMTMGYPVVMGYNTWLSLPFKPLPNRDNYVLCDERKFIHGANVLRSLDEVFELGREKDIFIIGGAMVYNSIINSGLLDEAYVTKVYADGEAEVFIDLQELEKRLPYVEIVKDISTEQYPVIIFKYYK